MILYNLFPRLVGPFTDWEPHLLRARSMGFDWVFVNPVQKTGGSKSLYAVADYFQLNADFVNAASPLDPDAQLRGAVGRARELGLTMMIDLVVNHAAYDSELVLRHPEWFVHVKGKVANPFCIDNQRKVVWGDLAQFDHNTRDRKGLLGHFSRVIEHLVGLGFEGFRCDAAYKVPGDFWRELIGRAKERHPDLVFSAETLGSTPDETRETARAGFDYVFNSAKWWDFSEHWLLEQYDLVRGEAPSIGFPESHDTPRLAEETGGNLDALKQRYLFTALFSAGVMMPVGFEFAARKRLHVVKTTPQDWEETGVDLSNFIQQVNRVKSAYAVFQDDCPVRMLSYTNPRILVMWRGLCGGAREEALIVLNKDVWQRQVFGVDSLRPMVQSGAPLECVSPENPLDYVPQPFHYELRPGEAVVLVTRR